MKWGQVGNHATYKFGLTWKDATWKRDGALHSPKVGGEYVGNNLHRLTCQHWHVMWGKRTAVAGNLGLNSYVIK